MAGVSSGPGFKGESYAASVARAAPSGRFRGGEVGRRKWFGAVVTSQGLHSSVSVPVAYLWDRLCCSF